VCVCVQNSLRGGNRLDQNKLVFVCVRVIARITISTALPGAPNRIRREGGGEEEEVFDHCKNELKRHHYSLSCGAGADLRP